MSHVAETGQLAPRVRLPRTADTVVIPSPYPLAYKSTFSFQGQSPMVRMPIGYNRASAGAALSSPTKSPHSDSAVPTLHAPRPVLSVQRPTFDLQSLHSDLSPGEMPAGFTTPHIRTPSGSFLIAGHHPSPILTEYMSNSFKEGTVPIVRDFTARHTLHNSDVISLTPTTVSAPEQAVTSTEYRKVNSGFEVKRGTVGALAIPLELPPLSLEEFKIPNDDRRQSRKLQKKPRSKSFAA